MPKVSIITASYNYEKYIQEAIESVVNQTISDWEMVIVDDGSKDNSTEVVSQFCIKDSRIKLFQHENGQNKGLAETLKLGIQKATGDWLVFLESDDTIEPNYLEEKFKIIEKYKNVGVVFNAINLFGEEEAIRNYDKYFIKQKKILNSTCFPTNLKKQFKKTHLNLIPTFSCVMIKKDLFDNIDFNSPIKRALDNYLWYQIANYTEFYYLDKVLTNWRMHKTSYMNSNQVNPSDALEFKIKKIEFLYGKSAYLRKFLVYLKHYRKEYFNLHFSKDKKEIIFFGKIFKFK